MKSYKIGIFSLVLTAFSQSASSVPFSLEARSMGMGNVGVATADIATAAFANPAMLAFQRENDDFSLLIGIGGFLNDNEGLIDDIDDFQSASTTAEAQNLLAQMNGKIIAPEVSASVAAGFSGETYAMAVSARSDVLAVGALRDFDNTVPGLSDPTKNIIEIQGVQTTEAGFSIARNFDVGGSKLAVGLTPKIVNVEAIVVSESVSTIGTDLSDLIDEDQVQDLGDYTTVDLGIVYGLSDSFQVGLVGKNIITDEINFTSLSGIPTTLKFDSRWRAGAAYRSRLLTVGVDLDIVENDPIVTSPVFSGLKSQMASFGAEFNAFDFAQLRVGKSKNIASGVTSASKDATVYAGVGFWLGFNIDLSVIKRNESLGAFVQTGFKF